MRRHLASALLLLGFLALWQLVASSPGVDDILLASPLEAEQALWQDRALLSEALAVTALEVVLGLLIAVVLALACATAMHLWRPFRDAAYPLLVASQAIPIVVLAPLFILAFDYGIGPKLAIVALVCFFPLAVNTMDGLRATDPQLLKLMRSMGASRVQTLRKAEFPAALPSVFSGLKVAASVSVIGAVFGEWAGADAGLGRLVLLANNQLQTPRVYAGVVLLTAMAILLFLAVVLLERVAIPWNRTEETR
jgi:ABC-type nitrate/sulfonate/bicarbonate transport system permease component